MAADDDLVAQARRGVESAFAELYHRYKLPLFHYCVAMVRSVEDAEDALQETFRYFFLSLARYVPRGRLKPYLYRLAHSFCIDILRRRQRASRPLEADLPAPGGSADLVEHVRKCIGELPAAYRAVLTLRLLHDFSYEEIAETLECPMGTVKSRIHHAIELLRQCLGAVADRLEI